VVARAPIAFAERACVRCATVLAGDDLGSISLQLGKLILVDVKRLVADITCDICLVLDLHCRVGLVAVVAVRRKWHAL